MQKLRHLITGVCSFPARIDLSRPTLCLVLCLFLCLAACKTKKLGNAQENPGSDLSERCMMKYDPGPCRGAYTRYYYDQKAGKCMSFIYGGCQGVVPFETLEDCRAACER